MYVLHTLHAVASCAAAAAAAAAAGRVQGSDVTCLLCPRQGGMEETVLQVG
jgi:hypothetical protein